MNDESDPGVVGRGGKHPTGVLIPHPTMKTECSRVRIELRRIRAVEIRRRRVNI